MGGFGILEALYTKPPPKTRMGNKMIKEDRESKLSISREKMSIKQCITGQWTTALMKYTWNDCMNKSTMNESL